MAVSKVEVAVLACLLEGSMHGYDVLERMRARGMSHWAEVGKASVYQALLRLERRGLLGGKDQEGVGGPDRRVYRITRAGVDRLKEGLAERFGDPGPYETTAGLALGFMHLLPAAEARRALGARERAVHELLEAVSAERARIRSSAGPAEMVATAMLDRQTSLAEAELAWIGVFRSTLGKLRR